MAAAHAFGVSWPPERIIKRSRSIGHWGANPGIAWIVSNLAEQWSGERPLQLVVGTGHATSYFTAHSFLSGNSDEKCFGKLIDRYGQKGGDPSEILDHPEGTPQQFGELGPAIAVSQGLSCASTEPLVCIVGDGELETSVAIAALAHGPKFLHQWNAKLLIVVNANGAKMGGKANFDPIYIAKLARALGYDVYQSYHDEESASCACKNAINSMMNGQCVVWISNTTKGWPAPNSLFGNPFSGHYAHKIPKNMISVVSRDTDKLVRWILDLAGSTIDTEGNPYQDICKISKRVTFNRKLFWEVSDQLPDYIASSSSFISPVEGIDYVLAEKGVFVFSPDEAQSNQLFKCINNRLVVEVLSEDVCFSWALGFIEGGKLACFATYEAFAPIVSSQIAQYGKLLMSRKLRGTPPLIVLITSLGLHNSPTHQNTDIVATFLARGSRRLDLICPVGMSSARKRLQEVYNTRTDTLCGIVCSKHPLMDLPDPGGALVSYKVNKENSIDATIIACGDICVTEAIAAMLLAQEEGYNVKVIAVIELIELASKQLVVEPIEGRIISVVWCAPSLIEGYLWRRWSKLFKVNGYRELYGVTARETLILNKLDRYSILNALFPNDINRFQQCNNEDELENHFRHREIYAEPCFDK